MKLKHMGHPKLKTMMTMKVSKIPIRPDTKHKATRSEVREYMVRSYEPRDMGYCPLKPIKQ